MTIRIALAARALLAAGLLSATVFAQAPAPAEPAQQPAGREGVQLPQSGATFRMAIDLVTTDVVVRDGHGQFIADLKKDDFEILEDGIKQEVASLTLVHGGRVLNQMLPPPPPPQEGIILPPQRPTNDAAGRIFLFLIDDLHMSFRDTPRVRQLFKKIAAELVHEGDMFAIVSSGTSSIAIDLTYDRKRLEEAANKISGSALKPSEIIEAGGRGPDGLSEVKYRAHTAFSTAYDAVTNLEKIHNRRKALILLSNGYDLNPFEGARFGDPNIIGQKYQSPGQMAGGGSSNIDYDPFSRQSAQFSDADLIREISELTKAANRANATIYAIDPRGLVAGADLDEQVDPTEWQNFVRKSQESLRTIAELTGGFASVTSNDFTKAIRRIDAETSDYYVLGYYSSNPDPTIRNRKLEVKTTRPNVEIWSRQSYSLKLPPAPKGDKK
jgi:VWFA-related protein